MTAAKEACDDCLNWKDNCLCPMVHLNLKDCAGDGSKILAAACMSSDGTIFALPPPARHCNILKYMHDRSYTQDRFTKQGFVLDNGAWIDRVPGKIIARAASQLLPNCSTSKSLFSEDLW